MRLSVQRDSGSGRAPVYRQIAEQIRRQVAAGALPPGSRLPAIRTLASDLGVNRDTVALAYEELATDGLVESTVGRGTFVRSPPPGESPSPRSFQPRLCPLAERLLDFERARPRFGSGHGAVPMHTLVPDPALFPAAEFRKVVDEVLAEGGAEILLYGAPQGHAGLRETLSRRLRESDMEVDPEALVICHGASQGIGLALRLFAEAGDSVALEEPTYNNALAAVTGLGLRPVAVPMREDGLDLAALDRVLARPEVKLLYTMPTFHNPMGTTTRLPHRRALLELASRHGKPIVEDGYEMDLRLDGRPVPPLAALDTTGCVVHLFSFSKSLFPGARVGAISARGRVVDGLLALKQATDLSDALPLQAALAAFVEQGAYDRHLERLRRELRARRDTVLEALERALPEGSRWTRPEGGYQIWVELPGGLDTSELLADAVGAGVLFAPGAQFHHDGRASSELRLSIASADGPALRRGVGLLGELVRQRLASAPRRTARVHV